MTFVLSVLSRDTLWVVADRRLSYGVRRPPVNDAVKVMCLDTTDGCGVLAYAGLGATSRGTQPSEWMSAVLRGHGGLTFEYTLGILASAATRALPKHLVSTPNGGHFIVIPAFVDGIGARLYSIDNVIDPRTRQHWYRYTSHQRTLEPGSPSMRIAFAGSGGMYFYRKGRPWMRALLSLVNQHDRGKISDYGVADYLARLNNEVYLATQDDGTVGPRSIVVWRRRKGTERAVSGGAHQFYTGVDRDSASPSLPTISNGANLQPFLDILSNQMQRKIAEFGFSDAAMDLPWSEIELFVKRIPSDPDEQLR
jgi:hypothetical protein